MDEPTLRILEAALRDLERMEGERRRLLEAIALGAPALDADQWLSRERELGSIVRHGEANARARGVQA
jgi:hypothetical protein